MSQLEYALEHHRNIVLTPYKPFDVIANKKKALKLKEKGNDAFKRKKYEVAEKFYSESLQLNLDSRPVWTNRAICRNTMKKHEDALADCLSALSIDPKNTKKGIQIHYMTCLLKVDWLSSYRNYT